ncbi:polysaccharide pyruvyl transferase family protein [Olivibacter ginsenosidimutans]|uniref:Polysaccharide pyruvyl transferase family protein n=1 Tax=Olivibacter ginsenosidimutans TaxID=1176537 RepID=A0ABP9C5A2_9SPHI
MNRRTSLKQLALLAGASAIPTLRLLAEEKPTTILLVSGWQYYNIGDIAHTPGLLALLNIFLPDTKVILWPNHDVRAIDHMLLRKFPDLQIVKGTVKEGNVTEEAVIRAAESADFMLHGSGPSVVAQPKLQWWRKRFKKPYGIYGVTVEEINPERKDLLDHAAFVYLRDTLSVKNLRDNGIKAGAIGFAPDATFAMDLRNDHDAVNFMNEHQLRYKKFLCVVTRLRRTPYYQLDRSWTPEQIREVDTLNDRYKEEDNAKLREAIVTWVRQTGFPVVVCPEMTYQLAIMDELVVQPLPPDVRSHVIKMDRYWFCDEAASLYASAVAVVSMECHSPIIACFNNTPAFYLRQPQDTIKGQMWYDIGLQDWVFEIEKSAGSEIAARLMEVYDDYEAAQQKLETAMDKVRNIYRETMLNVRSRILNG